MEFTVLAPAVLAGLRLDVFLSRMFPKYSRGFWQQRIKAGEIRVSGKIAPAHKKIKIGDEVAGSIVALPLPSAAPEDLPLNIVYEDRQLLVVDKARGITVHPCPGVKSGTLVNALTARCAELSSVGGELRPGIVHRLDRGTSGLLVIAKNDAIHHHLAWQFKQHTVLKRYVALAYGKLPELPWEINAPIGRHPVHRERMAMIASGRQARTTIERAEPYEPLNLLSIRIFTGRTHQIRVHLKIAGLAIAGDATYKFRAHKTLLKMPIGKRIESLHGIALHAYQLGFFHPHLKSWMLFQSPLPVDLIELLKTLKQRRA